MTKKIKQPVQQKPEIKKTQVETARLRVEHVALGLIIIMVFILGLKKLYSPDVGFHLAAGKWMLQHHEVMRSDIFTYGSFGNEYIDLHWLYQITLYLLFKWFASGGLVISNAVLITLSFVLLIVRMRIRNISNYHVGALLMIIGVQALPMEVRPHVFSWIFLNLVLLVLEIYDYKKINRLYLLPVIMVAWINFHSLAILGSFTIAAYVAGSYLQQRKTDKVLLRFFLISIAAYLINPFFLHGLLYPLQQFSLISGGLEKKYIGEFQTPFTLSELKANGISYILNPLFWLQVLVVISLVADYRLLKAKKYSALLVCLGFLFIVNLAVKNYGYFFFVSLPFMVESLQRRKQAVPVKNKKISTSSSFFSRYFTPVRISILSCVLAIIISWTTVTDGFAMLTKNTYRFGSSVDEEQLPVKATAFLIQHKLQGKLLNHLDFGGYLDYFYPEEKTFIDGRLELISKSLFEKYFNSRTRQNGVKLLIDEYQPDIIIFPYLKATGWWTYFISNPNWKAVYVDGLSVIYVPSNKFPELSPITEKDLLQEIPQYNAEQIGNAMKENKPSRAGSFFSSFIKKQNGATEQKNLSMFCFTVGFQKAALAYSVAAVDQSTVAPTNIYYNLYQYYRDKREYDTANMFLRKSGEKLK